MRNEQWRTVKGYENYEVSNMGNVRSIDRMIEYKNGSKRFQAGQNLTIQYDIKNGRPLVRLYDKKTKKGLTIKIHRLVMLTFVGERPEGMEICHADGDVTNNTLENLRYDTKSNNQIDIMKHSGKASNGQLTVDQVMEIRRIYADKEMNQYQLAEMFKVSQANISEIVNRKTYKFIDEDGKIA